MQRVLRILCSLFAGFGADLLILVAQFESFLDPLTIMLTVAAGAARAAFPVVGIQSDSEYFLRNRDDHALSGW